jgi:hypothetical protein
MHFRNSGIIYWGNISRCSQTIQHSNTSSTSQCWGGRICRWLLLFQEFHFEVIVKPGKLNTGPDHLPRITNGEAPTNLEDNFPDAQLFSIQIVDEYFADIIQYLSSRTAPQEFNTAQKKNLAVRAADYQLIA